MEFVRRIVDANSIMKVIKLPDSLKNRKVEIIILPVDGIQNKTIRNSSGIPDISEVTQSLIGSIPLSDISLEQVKEERLAKYESII